jgi:hypothetical protein
MKVSATLAGSPSAAAECTFWTYVTLNKVWRCSLSDLTIAGSYTLRLTSSAADATGWSGAAYERMLVVTAKREVGVAATAAAIMVEPANMTVVAGVPCCHL